MLNKSLNFITFHHIKVLYNVFCTGIVPKFYGGNQYHINIQQVVIQNDLGHQQSGIFHIKQRLGSCLCTDFMLVYVDLCSLENAVVSLFLFS